MSRTFVVHLPPSNKLTGPLPVVFDFHPLGGTGSSQESASGSGHQVRQRGLHRRVSQLGLQRQQRVERGLLLPGCSTEQGRRCPVHPGHDQVAPGQHLHRSQTHLRQRVLQRRRHVLHARLQGRRRDRRRGPGRLPVHHRGGAGKRFVVDADQQHGLHLRAPASDLGDRVRRRAGQFDRPLQRRPDSGRRRLPSGRQL